MARVDFRTHGRDKLLFHTVAVAQLAERQVVVLDVAGSSPVGHPYPFLIFDFGLEEPVSLVV